VQSEQFGELARLVVALDQRRLIRLGGNRATIENTAL
jgi:hypothetical protein